MRAVQQVLIEAGFDPRPYASGDGLVIGRVYSTDKFERHSDLGNIVDNGRGHITFRLLGSTLMIFEDVLKSSASGKVDLTSEVHKVNLSDPASLDRVIEITTNWRDKNGQAETRQVPTKS